MPSDDSDGEFDGLPDPHQDVAVALAMDAVRASALASEAWRHHIAASAADTGGIRSEVVAEIERRDASARRESAINAAAARWAPIREHRKQAHDIARAKPYPTWAEAARAIRDQITKTPDGLVVYTEGTIIGWLKKAGWRPPKKG